LRSPPSLYIVIPAKAGTHFSGWRSDCRMLGWTAPDGIDSARL
jgi:hypothetical protein